MLADYSQKLAKNIEGITNQCKKDKIQSKDQKLNDRAGFEVGHAYCGDPKYLRDESNCGAMLKEEELRKEFKK